MFAMIAREGEDGALGDSGSNGQWSMVSLLDSEKPQCPMNAESEDTFPIGHALDVYVGPGQAQWARDDYKIY